MSSTNRGYERHKSDYYVTPIKKIECFLREFVKYEKDAFDGVVLDPASGGDSIHPMSYPVAIKNVLGKDTRTIDIREDSLAELKADFLKVEKDKLGYAPQTIITNPPFHISREIIDKSIELVEDDGFVIMLLRLNYFGGKLRRDLWKKHMPKYCFIHSRRMSFTEDGKTDSIEYAHFVWQKGYHPVFTNTIVID